MCDLKYVYVLEVHNEEEYEDYMCENLAVFTSFKEAENCVYKYGYKKFEDEYYHNGIYKCDKSRHSSELLEKFNNGTDMFLSGYLVISKLPLIVGE